MVHAADRLSTNQAVVSNPHVTHPQKTLPCFGAKVKLQGISRQIPMNEKKKQIGCYWESRICQIQFN
jgi:hypothetical protein